MSSDSQNKIYYDVNINYNPTEADKRHNFFSRATTEIRLNGPLINDPMNYDLAISKFKIDTECIPVFIPEMKQPQPGIPAGFADFGERDTNYKVYIYYASYDPAAGGPPYYEGKFTRIEKTVTVVPNNGCVDFVREQFTLNHRFPTITSGADTYMQNTDPDFFFYDYQSFLDRINVAIERAISEIPEWPIPVPPPRPPPPPAPVLPEHPIVDISQNRSVKAAFFKVVDGKIEFHVSEDVIHRRILIRFSGNLYKYIGNGFKCRFYDNPLGRNLPVGAVDPEKNDGSFFIDFNPFAWRHKAIGAGDNEISVIFTDMGHFERPGIIGNEEDYICMECDDTYVINKHYDATALDPAIDVSCTYYVFKQQYSTLCNWNACKAILICSSSFPIKAEYYPTNTKNIFLTHYKEPWYINLVRQLYGEHALDDKAIFDKASTKILDVYYPLSSEAGDIRSTIIYDNQDIESGNKIDMIGGMDLENFDVYIKWVDIYGNVYDLYLAPGSSVNIRLCFTRKKIRKDELVSAFNRMIDNLEIISQSKVPPEDNSKTFSIKMEPKRKRNKVNLPGVLENGLIMKP